VETLKKTLAPFNEVEGVAGLLGIPFDARGLPTNTGPGGIIPAEALNVDPRAPEFKEILNRLSKVFKICVYIYTYIYKYIYIYAHVYINIYIQALESLRGHREFRDSERYHRWCV
jgi:hypothetical protein